jgi:hypothetical protein
MPILITRPGEWTPPVLTAQHHPRMTKIVLPALASLLVLAGAGTAHAQGTPPTPTPTAPPAAEPVSPAEPAPAAEPAAPAQPAPAAEPYRTDAVAQPTAPCVRQVRRIAPPPSPRRFRRQWPLAAAGSVIGWLAADRAVGPRGSPLVILSSSTLGAIVGSHLQAQREGHANLGRSIMGGVLGAFPAGAVLYMNRADRYDEAPLLTRGVVPVLGGALQGAATAGITSSSLQPTRIQIIECPHVPAAAANPIR